MERRLDALFQIRTSWDGVTQGLSIPLDEGKMRSLDQYFLMSVASKPSVRPIQNLPGVIWFTLNRFHHQSNGRSVKVNSPFTFHRELDMQQLVGARVTYRLSRYVVFYVGLY
jgi:hypothetical protein